MCIAKPWVTKDEFERKPRRGIVRCQSRKSAMWPRQWIEVFEIAGGATNARVALTLIGLHNSSNPEAVVEQRVYSEP